MPNQASIVPNVFPPALPSRADAEIYEAECSAMVQRKGPYWFVAPRLKLKSEFREIVLQPGDRVIPFEDFAPETINRLADRGVLLRGSDEGARVENRPTTCRWIVQKPLTCSTGVLPTGAEVLPEMLAGGRDALDFLVRRGLVRDTEAPTTEDHSAVLQECRAELERANAALEIAAQQLVDDDTAPARASYTRARAGADVARLKLDRAHRAAEEAAK